MISDKIIHHNDVDDMATTLVESKQYSLELELKLVLLEKQLEERISQSKREMSIISLEPATDGNNNGQPCSDGKSVPTLITEKPVVPTSSLHKLPTLTLPTFYGYIREWQTFWDSFECAVNLNASLSVVQNFTYLRSHSLASQGFSLQSLITRKLSNYCRSDSANRARAQTL